MTMMRRAVVTAHIAVFALIQPAKMVPNTCGVGGILPPSNTFHYAYKKSWVSIRKLSRELSIVSDGKCESHLPLMFGTKLESAPK